MTQYEERLNRIRAAVALEPTDQIPTVSGSVAFSCTATGTLMKDYLDDMELNCTTNIRATDMIGNLDAVQAAIYSCEQLPPLWLSEVRRAGRELPDNELWQVAEKELIHQSDYDEILANGFAGWYDNYLKERLHFDMQKDMGPFISYMPTAIQRMTDAGYPVINGGAWCPPFEMICGGRSLATFLMDDLMEIPDKVEKVFDVIHRFNMDRYESSLKSGEKPIGIWVGGWRGTPETLSPAMFERFSWKYMREIIELLIDYDVIPILHLDACWNLGLHYFKDIPAKKCIMALDGKTDIFKAMLCLVGGQGAGKSSFFRLLAIRDEWFSDDLKKLDDDRVYLKLQGHWIIEMSEMLATSSAKSIEEIRSFISRQKETYRTPYEAQPKDRLRQCVFGGSSNTLDFLPLDRAGNRRFLPIMIYPENAEVHILEDEDASRAYLLQVWAEAITIYRSGHYSMKFSKSIQRQLVEVQKDFMPEDTEAGQIQGFLEHYTGSMVCSKQLFKEALGHTYDEPKRWQLHNINEIMNTVVTGWKPFSNPRMFTGYGRQRGWERDVSGNEDGFVELTEEECRQLELPKEWIA